MKKWLIDTYLPMWAKETVLTENRALRRENRALQQKNKELEAYVRGLEAGIRAGKRILATAKGGKQ